MYIISIESCVHHFEIKFGQENIRILLFHLAWTLCECYKQQRGLHVKEEASIFRRNSDNLQCLIYVHILLLVSIIIKKECVSYVPNIK